MTLARRMADVPLAALFSSPLERCRETAAYFLPGRDIEIETREELIELDFGDWTGRTFEEIGADPEWRRFNRFREGTRIPGGETLMEAQARMVRLAIDVVEQYPDHEVLLVGHGDPLRALLLHYLGMPIGYVFRLELPPASWTTLELDGRSARLVRLNG